MKNQVMKTMLAFSWFSLFVLPGQGKAASGSFRKHNSLSTQIESQSVLSAKIDLALAAAPPQTAARCEEAADCLDGCWCTDSKCYGGEWDHRCANLPEGHDLGDGGWCHKGSREHFCSAADPNKKQKEGEELHEEIIADVNKDADKTMHKAESMDPKQMFWDDVNMMRHYLLPGKQPNFWKKLTEMILCLWVIVWFIAYRKYIYEDDRCGKMDRWAHVDIAARVDDPRISLIKPDVVLVFHKPDFEYSDNEKTIKPSVLKLALIDQKGHWPRTAAAVNKSKDVKDEGLLGKLAGHISKRISSPRQGPLGDPLSPRNADSSTPREGDEEEDDEEDGVTTYQEIRQALLQDTVEHLPQRGFDTAAFTSVDGDEIFVCIRLRNETTVKQHLQRYSMKLQLQHSCLKQVGVRQPADEVESSPPFIRYDRRFAENVFGKGKKDTDVFQSYGAHSGKAVVISGADRIRIIHKHLNKHINLDYAVANGLLVQWYPAHAEARIAELQKSWARWSLLTDLTVRQPLSLLNDYFGSRVAFIFAWMGLQAKMLLCLVPIACIWWGMNTLAHHYGGFSFWNRGSVMGFGVTVVIWAKISSNLWRQEETFLKVLWDLQEGTADRSKRPDFAGTMQTDPIDASKKSLQYPEWKYSLRQTLSWTVTLLFCCLVFCCNYTWVSLFSGRLNIAASICQAIMIQVFTQIYNIMAEVLTVSENHKYQDAFYNSYLKKMFFFQLINQYSAFFYMAIRQQFTKEGCPDGDCIYLIQKTLPVTLLILATMGVVQVLIQTLLVKLNLWLEVFQWTRQGQAAPVYGFVEEQAKYGQFRIREQIEVMTQLSLTLGFILIFGCVAPRIVPLCFLIFMIHLRAFGILTTTALKRTVPRMTVGIGPWSDVFNFLLNLGILFSAYLLVQFSPLFRNTLMVTKLTGMFLYWGMVVLIWICVDLACPPSSEASGADLLEDRRKAVEAKVSQIHEDKNFEGGDDPGRMDLKAKGENSHHGERWFCKEIVDANWAGVPKLIPDELLAKEASDEAAKSKA